MAAIAVVSCDRYEGGVEVPSYLKVTAIVVEDNPADSWSQDTGFFSCDIDAVNVIIWKSGDTAETNLGTFQLPCKIPVLRNGVIDKMRLVPVVKQDGIAGKRITYPYYEPINLTNVVLAEDSVTDLGTLRTRYISKNTMKVLWQEFFEPAPGGSTTLDSAVKICYSLDTVPPVFGGFGCGKVHVPAGTKSVRFCTDTTYNITDPQSILYLEMDYWSDFDFSVELKNPTYQDGPVQIIPHMTIYGKPERGWQKIYINIGAIWSNACNHYPNIRPHFTILNDEGREGNLFIDNIKLIKM